MNAQDYKNKGKFTDDYQNELAECFAGLIAAIFVVAGLIKIFGG